MHLLEVLFKGFYFCIGYHALYLCFNLHAIDDDPGSTDGKNQKEGESGRKKINQWTRYLTVIVTAFQAAAYIGYLKSPGNAEALILHMVISSGSQL
jgi:hypothetical protein